MFASTVGRRFGLTDEVVEDLKLAVSEAATDPVSASAGGDVSLVLLADEGEVTAEISSASWPRPDVSTDLPEGVDPGALDRLQVVRALFPSAERTNDDGVVTVRFSTGSRPTGS